MSGVSSHVAKRVVNLCRQRTAEWSRLRSASFDGEGVFHVEPLLGGVTNELFVCSAPAGAVEKGLVDPRFATVVVRDFATGGVLHDPEVERKIFESISDSGVGPRSLGYSVDGASRVEEFIVGDTLTCFDLPKDDVAPQIARRLAQVHAMDVDVPRDIWITSQLSSWLSKAATAARDIEKGEGSIERQDGGSECVAWAMSPGKLADTQAALRRLHELVDFEAEVRWLLAALRTFIRSPVAFCHNDAQEGNWLRRHADGELVLIDYEYGGYNPIAYDLANYFCEHAYNYQCEASTHPNFVVHKERFPTVEQQVKFAEHYLAAASKIAAAGGSAVDLGLTAEQLAEDARLGMLASHLLWSLWGVLQARTSSIEFGFVEYSVARAEDYSVHKEAVLRERPELAAP